MGNREVSYNRGSDRVANAFRVGAVLIFVGGVVYTGAKYLGDKSENNIHKQDALYQVLNSPEQLNKLHLCSTALQKELKTIEEQDNTSAEMGASFTKGIALATENNVTCVGRHDILSTLVTVDSDSIIIKNSDVAPEYYSK